MIPLWPSVLCFSCVKFLTLIKISLNSYTQLAKKRKRKTQRKRNKHFLISWLNWENTGGQAHHNLHILSDPCHKVDTLPVVQANYNVFEKPEFIFFSHAANKYGPHMLAINCKPISGWLNKPHTTCYYIYKHIYRQCILYIHSHCTVDTWEAM